MTHLETSVPLINFKKEYVEIKKDIDRAIKRVIERGWFILGPEVENFEKEFANYLGVNHVVGVASGTDAITLGLKALGISNGDGVVVPANVYPSSFGVFHSGATLQLADVDPDTLNLNVYTLRQAVNKKTRAVLAVHLYGNPVDIVPIVGFCKENNIALIEDCAQATGAIYKDRKVGSFGDIACFSFYPTKNLGAYGDGGVVATNNTDLAKKLKLWRMYGEEGRYNSVLVGHNSRLDEMQAAILIEKLKYVDGWNKRRRKIALKYRHEFSGLPIDVTVENKDGIGVYHLFVIKIKNRDKLAEFLKSKGITTGIHYPQPIHLTPSFSFLGYKVGDFPFSEDASREVLSLPIYPQMKEYEIKYIIETIKSYYSKLDDK